MQPLVEVAKREAKSSPLLHRHGAVLLDHRGKVLNVAHNFYGSKGPNECYDTARSCSVHAEIALFRGIPKNYKRILKLIVVRVSSDGESLANSHPCPSCQTFLRKWKRLSVFYSDDDGNIRQFQ
jgi:hypothetical protein